MNTPQVQMMVMVQQPIFRQGIVALLSTMAMGKIIGQPTSTSEALELARKCEPEVAVLDTLFDTIDMFELAQQMHTCSPRTAVILLSELEGEEWLFQAIKVGAAAYATRNITEEKLIETVHRVSQGEYLMNDDVLSQAKQARQAFQLFSETAMIADEDLHPLKLSPLSSREAEILAHIADGNSNKQIAKLLDISDQTVKNHITSILRKLNVNDRTAAVVYAMKQRWITME